MLGGGAFGTAMATHVVVTLARELETGAGPAFLVVFHGLKAESEELKGLPRPGRVMKW